MRRGAIALAALLVALPALGEPAATRDALATWHRAMVSRDPSGWDGVLASLARVRGGDDAWSLRAQLAAWDCLARLGRRKEAAAEARTWLAKRRPDWAYFEAARLVREADASLALGLLERMRRESPASALAPEADWSRAEALAPKDLMGAVAAWRRLASHDAADPLAERATFALASRSGEREVWLRRYLARFPSGSHRFEVARALTHVPGLSADERLDVAGLLLESADYGPAERMLDGLDSALATFRRGRAAWRLGDPEKGIRLLRQAAAMDPKLQGRAGLVIAQIRDRQGHRDLAAAEYRRVSEQGGADALEALDKWSAMHRRVDETDASSTLDRRIAERYPTSDEAAEARFRLLWRSYRAGRLDEARRWAAEMGQAMLVKVEGPAGGYWLARMEEQTGAYAQATAHYREVVGRSPRSYYGWRSRFRLAAIEGGAVDPGFGVNPVSVQLGSDAPLAAIDGSGPYGREFSRFPSALREAAFLGDIEPAVRHARLTGASDNLKAWLSLQAGRYGEAIHQADGTDPYLGYPLGFYPLVRSAAEPQGLDPLLLTALVKQESSFDPRARSWVGAVGLSQLMPFTADWVGKKVPGPVRPLTDPFWNLKLGAYYLGWVQHRLDDQPLFAVAAYNAGPNAVKKWRDAFGSLDVDAWVESIPFPETRHYVKKVFGNYWTYRSLYGTGR